MSCSSIDRTRCQRHRPLTIPEQTPPFNRLRTLLLLLASVALTACRSAEPPRPTVVPPPSEPAVGYGLPGGAYRCEAGQTVELMRDAAQPDRLAILWHGQIHSMERDPSSSGLPRFHDRSSGLVWIELPWKGVLLDGTTHTPLASECLPPRG